MKKLLTTLVAITLMAILSASASGIYLVSGGDFRKPWAKYVIETTNANQSVVISPNYVKLLSSYGNYDYVAPWSVKADGVEHEFGTYDNIGVDIGSNGYVGSVGGTNVAELTHTFANPGSHVVKVFNTGLNIYNMKFFNNPSITQLYVDMEYAKTQRFSIWAWCYNLSNLKSVYYANPSIANTQMLYVGQNCSNMVSMIIKHPENISTIYSHTCAWCYYLTNDVVFSGASWVGYGAFQGCRNVHYASFESATNIGACVLNLSTVGSSEIRSGNLGLYRIRLGECLQSIGVNSFYGHENLTTVEFKTDKEDWVSAWNSHAIFPNYFGTAVLDAGSTTNATITPLTSIDQKYCTGARWARPTKLVVVR